jgi:hypothetical protein
MIAPSIERLDYLISTIPPLVSAIPDKEFTDKPAPGKWSKKEILGHLIDSATNNHQRFIRSQFENEPVIFYDQEKWNLFSHYNRLEKDHVIAFWTMYNKHLLEIIKRIPEHNFGMTSISHDNQKVTLEFLVTDYVVHMEHHLKQIVKY